jgi:lipid-A-disaccharide synthase
MKYYLVVGEASGDLHASNLMQGIKDADPSANFRFFGGDLMAEKGGTLVKHYRSMAFMGFLEVVLNLRTIAKNLSFCKKDILQFNPDVVILVDYPGFNLRIARFANEKGFKVFYYIAPKVWAWKESRVKRIRQYVDNLFVIFPFEIGYFKKHGIDAIYEGNPLVDAIAQQQNTISHTDFITKNNLSQKPIIALLAGSRKQEIRYNLPNMLTLIDKIDGYQFVIAGAPSLGKDVYAPYIASKEVMLIFGQTQDLLKNSVLAIVTSGTATLEAALLDVPEVVCYRGNTISMFIAWLVIKVKYISLVNLIMGKEVVKELKQFDYNPSTLKKEVESILPGTEKRSIMLNEFNELKGILGGAGASKRVAKRMVDFTNPNNSN